MKIAFATCVKLGLDCMEEIYRIGGNIHLAVTLHDDIAQQKSGRVYIDKFCHQYKIDVIKVWNINEPDVVKILKTYSIDYLFIIGWSQIAGKEVLEAPRRGVLGMHPTLLPEGRGRASIPWAIIKGLRRTGVTMFKLDEGVDTGPILAQRVISIEPNETATSLYDKVCEAHVKLIEATWKDLITNNAVFTSQDSSQASEWTGRRPEDGEITKDMSVYEVDRLVRAVTHPYPGAFLRDEGQIIRIWKGRISDLNTAPVERIKRIHFKDGAYEAICYSIDQDTDQNI